MAEHGEWRKLKPRTDWFKNHLPVIVVKCAKLISTVFINWRFWSIQRARPVVRCPRDFEIPISTDSTLADQMLYVNSRDELAVATQLIFKSAKV